MAYILLLIHLFSFSEDKDDNMSKIPSLALPLTIPVKFGRNPRTRIRNTEILTLQGPQL